MTDPAVETIGGNSDLIAGIEEFRNQLARLKAESFGDELGFSLGLPQAKG